MTKGSRLCRRGATRKLCRFFSKRLRRSPGRGSSDPYEGWANYNLGYTLLQLGRCDESLAPLERSDQLQDRGELDAAITAAEQCAGND